MNQNNKAPLEILGKIFQEEMAGIVRYLHYSFMIMGHNRIPIQKWFRDQATESTAHAIMIGEKITSLGGHPPVVAAKIEETNQHGVQKLLEESLVHERATLELYRQLVHAAGDDIAIEAEVFFGEAVGHQVAFGALKRHARIAQRLLDCVDAQVRGLAGACEVLRQRRLSGAGQSCEDVQHFGV